VAPNDAEPDPIKRYLRGLVHVQHGDFDAAISDYSYAIEHKPERSEIYLQRGIAFDCSGQFEFALADFQAYELRNPEQPFGAFYQGRTWAKLGNTTEAVACYERALSISPNDAVGAKAALAELKART
jgi:tetratricopeptide (TPR) repeat protein